MEWLAVQDALLMKKIKKICFIGYSLSGGGAERNIINLSRYLIKKGWLVDIILFFNINDYSKEYRDMINAVHIISIFNEEKTGFKRQPGLLIKLGYSLYTIIKKNNYDLIIGSVEVLPFYMTTIMGWVCRKKTVIIVGNNLLKVIKENYNSLPIKVIHFWLIKKIIFKKVSKIICVSFGLKKQLTNIFNIPQNKIEVIYNGLDLKIISKKRKENIPVEILNKIKNNKTIIFFGRLVEKKGLILLMRAFREIHYRLPSVKLLIMGKGCYKKKVARLIKEYSLTSHIIMTGFVDNPYSYLQKSDLFVFPSSYEGFGNVIIEAMACGLPIVSTDCDYGPREILSGSDKKIPSQNKIGFQHQKYGILSPINNMQLANACIDLLSNRCLYETYKKRSIERSKFFSLRRMGEHHHKLFSSLLN